MLILLRAESSIRCSSSHSWLSLRSSAVHSWISRKKISQRSPVFAAHTRSFACRNLTMNFVGVSMEHELRKAMSMSLIQARVPVELHHYHETFHGFDTVAASEVARCARR